MQWRYAARLAQHAATDALWAPLSEATASRRAVEVLRATTMVPVTRVAAALHYKLHGATRGAGRPIPKTTWDYEFGHKQWALLDSVNGVAENMVIVGYVHRLWKAPKVLDIGCGSGTLADFIQLIPDASYTGIDLSAEAVSQAKARGLANARFEQGAMEEWRPAERYQAIIFNETLYYVRDPSAVLLRYTPWLAEGGAFILSIWRSGNFTAMWRRIHEQLATVACATVTPGEGTARDIQVLRPRAL